MVWRMQSIGDFNHCKPTKDKPAHQRDALEESASRGHRVLDKEDYSLDRKKKKKKGKSSLGRMQAQKATGQHPHRRWPHVAPPHCRSVLELVSILRTRSERPEGGGLRIMTLASLFSPVFPGWRVCFRTRLAPVRRLRPNLIASFETGVTLEVYACPDAPTSLTKRMAHSV